MEKKLKNSLIGIIIALIVIIGSTVGILLYLGTTTTEEEPVAPIIITPPADITYTLGDTGNSLIWTATDDNPDTYTISRNGGQVDSGTWTSGLPITISVDGLSAGIYTYVIIVEDEDALTATDSATVTVLSPPSFSKTPSDISFKFNTTENILSWTPIDDNPDTYTISQDSVTVVPATAWTSGVPITYDVSDLALGNYNFEIIVSDDDALSASDSVLVNSIPTHNYGEALQKSIYFYMQQRSGDLPEDNPVIWRDDSCLNDGADWSVDLTGGYFDAGDHVKYNLPMASTVTTLAWALYEFEDAFIATDQLDATVDAIKWATDYLMKCHISPYEYFFQVAWGQDDHDVWASAEMIDRLYVREAFKANLTHGATTPIAATAAALAFTSIVLETIDPVYAAQCLGHAEILYDFANLTRNDDYYNATAVEYLSYSGFWDELAAAGALLYLKTGNEIYLNESKVNIMVPLNSGNRTWTHVWDQMNYMTYVLLAQITGNETYIEFIEEYLDWWLPTGEIDYTPGGLAWLSEWGALRYAANTAFVASIWATDPLSTPANRSLYLDFVENQINYALGDNPEERSYMCGFGVNPPINPHHRTAHGSWAATQTLPENNQHILFGALVGGPGLDDSYEDDRADFVKNEVACDYNSGLVGALAYLSSIYSANMTILDDFPENYFTPEDERLPEMFALAKMDVDRDPRGEILDNGNFTDGFTSWTDQSFWSPAVYEYVPIDGYLFVNITNAQNPTGEYPYYIQLVQGPLIVEKGFNYTISFDARGNATREIDVALGQSGGAYTRFGEIKDNLTTSWTHYEYSFIMTHDTEVAARIEFNLAMSNTSLSIDNVSIIESAQVELIEYEGEILQNGDFSEGPIGLDSWTESSTWYDTNFTIDASSGVAFVNISDITGNGWEVSMRQEAIGLQANQNYTMSFYAWADAPRSLRFLIQNVSLGWPPYAYSDIGITTTPTLYELTFNFTNPRDDTNARFEFQMGLSDINLYIDNVSIYSFAEVEQGLPSIEGELVTNGDFSDGQTAWSDGSWSGANATYNIVAGEFFIDILDNESLDYEVQITQSPIPLRTGITYNCSFYARGTDNRTIKVLLVQPGTYMSYYEIEYNLTTKMTKYEFTYTMTYDTDEAAIFQMNFGGVAVSVYLDDIGIYSPDIIDYVTTTVNIRLCNYAAWPARSHDDLAYRYFFDVTEVYTAGFTINDVAVTLDPDSEATVTGPIQWSGYIYYVEVYYDGVELFPAGGGNEYREAQLILGLKALENYETAWDPTNDWSYQGLNNDWSVSDYIPVYDYGLGTILYGTVPP